MLKCCPALGRGAVRQLNSTSLLQVRRCYSPQHCAVIPWRLGQGGQQRRRAVQELGSQQQQQHLRFVAAVGEIAPSSTWAGSVRPVPVSGSSSDSVTSLVNDFTSPALAAALLDREATLRECNAVLQKLAAVVAPDNEVDASIIEQRAEAFGKLHLLLAPYAADNHKPYEDETKTFSDKKPLDAQACADLRQRLHRIPRQVKNPTVKRASVLIPLCNVDGEASVLLTTRSQGVTHHKGEVCFPGGMADSQDTSIFDTALRETQEEIGLDPSCVEILGVLRCDWTRVEAITGTAVTPVVGFLGDLDGVEFNINQDEVWRAERRGSGKEQKRLHSCVPMLCDCAFFVFCGAHTLLPTPVLLDACAFFVPGRHMVHRAFSQIVRRGAMDYSRRGRPCFHRRPGSHLGADSVRAAAVYAQSAERAELITRSGINFYTSELRPARTRTDKHHASSALVLSPHHNRCLLKNCRLDRVCEYCIWFEASHSTLPAASQPAASTTLEC